MARAINFFEHAVSALKVYDPRNSLYQSLRETITGKIETIASIFPYIFRSGIKCGSVSKEELREIQRQDEIRRQHGYEGIDDDKPYS